MTEKRYQPTRTILFCLGIAACFGSLQGSPVWAEEGDRRTSIFVGTTNYSDGTSSTSGTSFGGAWSWEFISDLQWNIGASYSTTDGEYTDSAGTVVETHARTTSTQSGLTWLFNNQPGSRLVGFMGGGISILSYNLDFDYPESKVGKTSGYGPGVYARIGGEFGITSNIQFIPSFVASAHRIKTESDDSYTLTSTSLLISIRVGI